MSHSNSSLNTFAACMAKYEHIYIKHSPPCRPPSAHLTFGTMAHDVLHKAGLLRDEVADGVVDMNAYYSIIPSEVLHDDLKSAFNIHSWQSYFTDVIKATAKYEKELVQDMIETFNTGSITIERELKLQLSPDQMADIGVYGLEQPSVGIIDLLILGDNCATIIDYKFSSSRKTQDDFDMNSQLPLYATFVHYLYDIPFHNIKYGYIDIPKQSLSTPALLGNGTLSRAKNQNVSQEMYEKAVIAVHGEDDPIYNCRPGGHYYDAWCNMALNKAAYLSVQFLDADVVTNVSDDLFSTAQTIDKMIREKSRFLRKFDSYSCKGCDYINSCKPWLGVDTE